MEGKTLLQAPVSHLPKEAGLDGGREPCLKDPQQIAQLPGMQCSVQQGKGKERASRNGG